MFFLPQKYVRPTLLFPSDEAVGSISIKQLINMLVIGATGTGKTVAIKILMAKIAKFQPNAKIWLLDFKRFDFRGFSSFPGYYGYTDCIQGLNDFYDAFKRQQEAGVEGEPNYLIIDEWGSFIMSLEVPTATAGDGDSLAAQAVDHLPHFDSLDGENALQLPAGGGVRFTGVIAFQ